jgi:hypothetical protein
VNHLVVAHHTEYLLWLSKVAIVGPEPWTLNVVTNGFHRPNTGREAGAYLWWLTRNHDRIDPDDTYAFVQGDPFAHCYDLTDRLRTLDVSAGWVPLSDLHVHTHADGSPHHAGLPVAAWYEQLTGEPFPPDGYDFWAGGQFAVSGKTLLRYTADDYAALADLAGWVSDVAVPPGTPQIGGAWVLERLWEVIFR